MGSDVFDRLACSMWKQTFITKCYSFLEWINSIRSGMQLCDDPYQAVASTSVMTAQKRTSWHI
jgi:hypothetical protein